VPELDTRHAHPARVYNYWLGGKDNYPADREAAEAAIAANPRIVTDVRANRAFLARVVRYLAADCGIRQFLDIGTGLPTASNTHEPCSPAPRRGRRPISTRTCATPRSSSGRPRRPWTSSSRSRSCC